MKTKIQLIIVAVLLSGCATGPAPKNLAQQDPVEPLLPKATADMNLNSAFSHTAEVGR